MGKLHKIDEYRLLRGAPALPRGNGKTLSFSSRPRTPEIVEPKEPLSYPVPLQQEERRVAKALKELQGVNDPNKNWPKVLDETASIIASAQPNTLIERELTAVWTTALLHYLLVETGLSAEVRAQSEQMRNAMRLCWLAQLRGNREGAFVMATRNTIQSFKSLLLKQSPERACLHAVRDLCFVENYMKHENIKTPHHAHEYALILAAANITEAARIKMFRAAPRAMRHLVKRTRDYKHLEQPYILKWKDLARSLWLSNERESVTEHLRTVLGDSRINRLLRCHAQDLCREWGINARPASRLAKKQEPIVLDI